MCSAAPRGLSDARPLHDIPKAWLRPLLTVLITILVALSIPLAATPVSGGADTDTDGTVDVAESTPGDVLLVDDDGDECSDADYSTIQPALDDSAPGDTVLVCRGIYTDNVSVDTPGVTLQAANESVVLDGEQRLGAGVRVRASGATVDGLTVRGYTSAGILVAGDKPLADVRVTDNDVSEVDRSRGFSFRPGIYVDGARGAQVSGNRVTDSGSGIWLIGSRDTTVRNNELREYSYIGILESSDINSLRAERNEVERRLGEVDLGTERQESINASDVRFDVPDVTRRAAAADTHREVQRPSDTDTRGPDIDHPGSNLSALPAELNASLTGRRSLYALSDNRTASARTLSTGSDDPRVAPTNNTIANNQLAVDDEGLTFFGSIGIVSYGGQDGTIRSNAVSGGSSALIVDSAVNPEVRNNRLTDSGFGLLLLDADRALLRNNRMADNEYNLDVTGSYDHDIDRSNSVDGAPVLYRNGADDCVIEGPTEYGYIGIVNAENVTVRDVTLSNQGNGLHLSNVDGALVENVTLANNYEGIRVQASDDVTVRDVEAHNNTVGAYTRDGRQVRVTDSDLRDNGIGVVSFRGQNPAQSADSTAPGTVVTDTSISGGSFGAVYFGSSDSSLGTDRFVGNEVNTSSSWFFSSGVLQFAGGNTEIADNRFDNAGVELFFTTGDIEIRDNTIRTEYSGVTDFGSEGTVTVRNNDIRAEDEGIETFGSEGAVTIRNNDIRAGDDGLLAFGATGPLEIRSNTVEADDTGIASVATDRGGDIVDNEVDGGRTGMSLRGSSDHRLRDNTITGADAGFSVTRGYDHDIDRSNTVDGDPIYYLRGETGTTITADDEFGYLAIVDSTAVTVRDLAVNGGLPVAGSQAVTVRNVTVQNARGGIRLADSRNSRVSGARVTGEGFRSDGIVVRSCEDCTTLSTESAGNEIVDNRVSGPAYGILVGSSTGDTVVNNTVEDTYVGIGASSATGTSVDANTVRSSRIGAASFRTEQVRFTSNRITGGNLGLVLSGAQGNVLRDNTMSDNEDGFRVLGGYVHDIDRSNTVGGDPIYYLRGEAGTSITGEDDPGYVAVVDSTDVTVRNVTLDGAGSLPVVGSQGVTVEGVTMPAASGGVQFINTQESVVQGAQIKGDRFFGTGIAVRSCTSCLSGAASGNNEVRNVQVQDAGIVIVDSSNDAITDSEVTGSFFGVALVETDGTTIRRNDISDSFIGALVFNDDPTAATTTVARLERNTVTDNRRGVYLDAEVGRVAVVENTIVRNEVGVSIPGFFFSSSETDPQYNIRRNHLDNDEYGVENDRRGFVVDATNNYWGAADGPSSPGAEPLEDPETGALADGSGDAVSRGENTGVSNVRFDPFLEAPPSAAPAPPAENDSTA
ncbi:hypothetical protein BRC84_02915 [Halobacteriales archaeon QS_1_68_44]|nr:MAG: hypothetical protein BRC84_02915 [Halobacteriales archaeon QS_1_68_44]